ncbi:MAG TPA: hypothetical protein VF607_03515 [Verrucomicrobiae bacterium]
MASQKASNLPATPELCVKELAHEMKVSTRYVYEMRRCGFRMRGQRPRAKNKTTTVAEAIKWIKAHDFTMASGKGVFGPDKWN